MEGDLAVLETLPIGREGITAVLPHRDPFLWVDRIVELEPGVRAVGELDVSPDLDFFRGHFPGHPVMPGVLIMEALAQVGAYAILSLPKNEGKLGFFGGMDKVRFRKQVVPGDVLVLTVDIVRLGSRGASARAIASVDGVTVAEADQMYVIG